jgi:hypothetical protein
LLWPHFGKQVITKGPARAAPGSITFQETITIVHRPATFDTRRFIVERRD